MALLHVISTRPVSGKTAIAVGLARGFADAGLQVRLLRAGTGEAAEADAATFAALAFASSAGSPVAPEEVADVKDAITIVEHDAGAAPVGANALVVVRGEPTEADGDLARQLGRGLLGTIATLVPSASTESTARALTNAGLRPLALLPEDRVLAGPGVDEIRSTLDAEVLYEGENALAAVDDVVIAPVYTDPARPHFGRYERSAILTPSYKTDLLLAAIEAGSLCLVVTGGTRPSGYVLDRVQGGFTTLLMTRQQTFAAVNALSDVWTRSRFRGERKAAAAHSLLRARLDFASLPKKLA